MGKWVRGTVATENPVLERQTKVKQAEVSTGLLGKRVRMRLTGKSDVALGSILGLKLDRQVGENISRTRFSMKNPQKD